LAVVVLVELILFTGYFQERWLKGLVPLGEPRARAGEGLIIRSDGLGYYAWLRSLLFDGDWSFDNEFDEHNILGDYVPPRTERTAVDRRPNPWSIGPACVWAVLVVPGHFVLHAVGAGPADGYALPYQLLVGAATLLASFGGLGFVYGIARRYAAPGPAALTAAFLTLGTGLVYYNTLEPTMAHGIGTAAVAGLVWYWLRTYGSRRPGRWLLVGVLLGLVMLVRWQLATLVVLPVGEVFLHALAGLKAAGHDSYQPEARARGFPSLALRAGEGQLGLRYLALLLLTALGTAAGFAPQMFAWHCVYGDWLVAPMAVAHNWLHPAWWHVLATPDRGLFYWTPLCLLAVLGALRGLREDGPLVLLGLAFALQVYALASVWGTGVYLGVAFGFRQLTEAVVLLTPGLALLLGRTSPRGLWWLGLLGCGLVLWNLLLLCQYRYGLVPANAGVEPATLLANVGRLVVRKRLLLVGQVLLGPLLLGLYLGRLVQRSATLAALPTSPA
jgi:hypothetical protein